MQVRLRLRFRCKSGFRYLRILEMCSLAGRPQACPGHLALRSSKIHRLLQHKLRKNVLASLMLINPIHALRLRSPNSFTVSRWFRFNDVWGSRETHAAHAAKNQIPQLNFLAPARFRILPSTFGKLERPGVGWSFRVSECVDTDDGAANPLLRGLMTAAASKHATRTNR